MVDETLSIKIRNLVEGAQEVERLARDYDHLERETRRDFNDPTDRMRGGVHRTRNAVFSLRNAVVALGGALVAREYIQATNRFRQLEGQLNTVTESQEETNERFRDLKDIANETFAALDSTVNLYARVTRATEALGDATEAQVLRFTRVVNQAVAASGATQAEASAAITQLTQGLASGVFRAEEFNSVLEQTPRLAQAIADGLGVTIGQLRQMLLDGELTSERVFGAILDQTEEIEREFNALPKRVDQSLTQLGNDLTAAFGRADVDGLVEAIDDFREIVTDPQFVAGVNSLAEAVFELAAGLAEVVKFFEGPDELNTDRQERQIQRLRGELERLLAEQNRLLEAGDDTVAGFLDRRIAEVERALRRLGVDPEEALRDPASASSDVDDEDAEEEAPKLPEAIETDGRALIGGASNPAGGPLLLAEAYRKLGGEIIETGEKAKDTHDEISEFAEQAARNIQDVFADFLFDPFEDGLEGMLRGFVTVIRRMIAEAAAAAILDDLFGSQGQTGAQGLQAFFASFFHGGRDAGGSSTVSQRPVSPLAFVGAPRLHQGIRADEIPAILHRSEDVVTADSPRHSRNFQSTLAEAAQSGGGGLNLRVVNALNPDDIADAMAGPAGEQVVLNHIGRNPESVQGAG